MGQCSNHNNHPGQVGIIKIFPPIPHWVLIQPPQQNIDRCNIEIPCRCTHLINNSVPQNNACQPMLLFLMLLLLLLNAELSCTLSISWVRTNAGTRACMQALWGSKLVGHDQNTAHVSGQKAVQGTHIYTSPRKSTSIQTTIPCQSDLNTLTYMIEKGVVSAW